MINWVCRKKYMAGFTIVIEKSNIGKNPMLQLDSERNNVYKAPKKKC